MRAFLNKRVDNAPLIVFRMVFGGLLAYQCFYYIYEGWIWRNLIRPKFTFAHIGFEWLQPLPGDGMYYYFAIMGLCAIAFCFGYFYRISLTIFTLMWTCVYLMQKTTYNNHHYLIILVCILLLCMPANRYASADANRSGKSSLSMPDWCRWLMVSQMAVVYVFASLAKFYPGWLDGTFSEIMLGKYAQFHGIGLLRERWVHLLLAWGGIAFDLLIIPMLLWKRTRITAILLLLVFHAFNSVTLDIGIFPFLALSMVVFFFEPDFIRRIFFPKKPELTPDIIASEAPGNRNVTMALIGTYLAVQLFLPLRHWFIKGDVLWTEEGHRLAWRMMLRDRKGELTMTVIDKKTGAHIPYKLQSELTKRQLSGLKTHPDMIWQMAQRIKRQMAKNGREVAVYADVRNSINRAPMKTLLDPSVDLAAAEWNYFGHADWIITYGE
ncbi:HTTM domain-containing protein [Flavobacterium selenitireducens]|uniref:HTTM domain-containing protein n=1 Tax=Flavobacterium selenitireducens TaxID=2722704 RepID=UPI00168ACD84|nr:HTTM domain-containing protein [Flavobacterium selenitireducens]MBD3583982.1 HTTM domain-containing protein [Flavobacterium selenitireducens]